MKTIVVGSGTFVFAIASQFSHCDIEDCNVAIWLQLNLHYICVISFEGNVNK